MTKSIVKKSTTGSLPPAVPLAITPTFSPWTHTSDDSYIYQLSLVLATAIVSFLFERSEFLIDTSQKKSLRVCTRARVPCVRLLLVLVCRIMYHIRTYLSSAPKIRICRYVCTRATSPPQKKEQKAQHRLRERHTHNASHCTARCV